MPDLTLAMASKYNALLNVKKGADIQLFFLLYKNTNKFEKLHTEPFIENFNVSSTRATNIIEGRQVGFTAQQLEFADVDGNLRSTVSKANGCIFDNRVYKLEVKTQPRLYSSDDTDFSRVWQWYMTDTNEFVES